MDECECIRLHVSLIPEEIKLKHNLHELEDKKGWVCLEIRKGMCGSKQAGRIAHDRLKTKLAEHGHHPSRHTAGLWTHNTRPIQHALVVDDFGVKHVGKDNALHLLQALQQTHEATADWEGKLFCRIHLQWNHEPPRWVNLTMPGCVHNALNKLQHTDATKARHSPSKHIPPKHGAPPPQGAQPREHTLTPQQTKRLQTACGLFLHCARATDSTMLHALNDLSTQIHHGDAQTMQALDHFLDHCVTHPEATIRCCASDMVLWIHSDAGCNNTSKARSRVGGHFWLGNQPGQPPTHTGTLLATAKVIKNVMASATEAELAAMCCDAQEAVPLRQTLVELGHPQPPTPIVTDNAVAEGTINKTVKQQKSRAMDMRFCWVQDRTAQGQFRIIWKPGETNKADCHTKHHSEKHHQQQRSNVLHIEPSPASPWARVC